MRAGWLLVPLIAAPLLIFAGCGTGSATPSPSASPPPSAEPETTEAPSSSAIADGPGHAWSEGESLCVLLGPGDFPEIPGVTTPDDQSDTPGDHYCTYTPGIYPSQGGVELDVFVGPDAEATYDAAVGEVPAGAKPTGLAGVDASAMSLAPASGSAFLVVRRGTLVFVLALPQGPDVGQQLKALGRLVLKRATAIR